MTFMPALASSAARMPPVPPTPTMTTSVFSVAMVLASRPGLQTGHRQPREGLLALHVGLGEGGLRAGKADEPPAGKVLVAAIDRIGKHAFDRMRAYGVEECLRARPGEARRLALLDRRDHLVLL